MRLDASYIKRKRKRKQLEKLRDELRAASDSAESEETNTNRESKLRAREYEDDAQELDMLERDGNLVARYAARLEQVERALNKIEEGS